MFDTLPNTTDPFMNWPWARIDPYVAYLLERPLNAETAADWLQDWTTLANLILERFTKLRIDTTLDTTNLISEAAYNAFLSDIYPEWEKAEQKLIQKLMAARVQPEGMALPIKKMQTDAELFREANLPLLTLEMQLGNRYNKISGAQTVEWGGKSYTITQLNSLMETPNRADREAMWRLTADRQLADSKERNTLWQELLDLRRQMAENAGFDNYLSYRWQQLKRFDYTPEDSDRFREAIATAVVPAATRIYEAVKTELGVDALRPWDVKLDIYPLAFPELHPFIHMSELEEKSANIYRRVDPALGNYFDQMRQEHLMDLANRAGKGPGAYCTYFPVAKRPYIFMNAVGTADDVKTMLHETGHAFHSYEASVLPYVYQRHPGSEFAEVASMAMELLGAPYLTAANGGFYATEAEAARHRINHLHKIITFWPYMAVVDGFQHWVYRHMDEAMDPTNCNAKWAELWRQFIPGVDFTGFEEYMVTGWHRKLHIFRYPFYYVEYGMAQVGAIQVWRNSLVNQVTAVAQYRHALSLGGTRTLPDLFAAAGATFRFDTAVMQEVVGLLEQTLSELS